MTCRTCHSSLGGLRTALAVYFTDIEEADHDLV